MEDRRQRVNTAAAVIGALAILFILVFGTIWMGRIAKKDTDTAVRSVSLLYLEELLPLSCLVPAS